jgi:hypothetical protein
VALCYTLLAPAAGVAHWAGRSRDPILQRWGVGALAHLVASSKVVLTITRQLAVASQGCEGEMGVSPSQRMQCHLTECKLCRKPQPALPGQAACQLS